ncbi:polysaccharide pyruvyl transferase family protein [Desulfobulbus propionicus]
MKIGTLTLMHGYNYGGMLQCYSLQKAVREMGHDVAVINFHPREKMRKLRQRLALLGPLGRVLQNQICALRYGQDMHHKFEDFRRNCLNLSRACNTRNQLRSLVADFDVVITGSDQVWNMGWLTPEYFLDFTADLDVKTISYAACFGTGQYDLKNFPQVKGWIANIDSVSVRNEMSSLIVDEAGLSKPPIVCDPTLLVDVSELEQDLGESGVPEKYVLLYALSENRLANAQALLSDVKEKSGLPLVGIKSCILQSWPLKGVDHVFDDPSIEQWVSLFNNATFVLTDSYHGLLFALKYSVPVINYIGRDHGYERIADVVERYGLEKAFFANIDVAYENALQLDFGSVQKKMDIHKEESFSFLRSCFGEH